MFFETLCGFVIVMVTVACGRISFDEQTCGSTPVGCTRAAIGSSVFLFCQPAQSFDDAESTCASASCSLARIDTEAENAWVLMKALELLGQTGSIWLGGSDRVDSGTWLWPDGTQFYRRGEVGTRFANWGGSEPNNLPREDCLELRQSQLNAIEPGQWNDIECSNTHKFVCR